MKILVTSIVDLKKSQNNRLHHFLRYLYKNHDITVISINDWWKHGQGDLNLYSKDYDDIYQNITYHYLTDKKFSPIQQELFSTKKVNEIIKKESFDVHYNYATFISGYTAAKKIKTVYDIADDNVAIIKESPLIPPILRPAAGAFASWMLNRNFNISKTITISTGDLINSCRIPEEKTVVIPNGVDLDRFKNYGPVAKDKLNLQGFVLGYVGVLREWIDFKPIFSALRELNKDINIVIVGKEGGFSENVQLAKDCGVEDRVHFAGMVPYSQVPEYISAMDICFMPFKRSSISENAIPLKLFEYMACGKPIISTRMRGIESVAGDKIFYASEKDDYKKCILQLYNDEKLRKRMGLAGRTFVEQKYDWSILSKQLEETLKKPNEITEIE